MHYIQTKNNNSVPYKLAIIRIIFVWWGGAGTERTDMCVKPPRVPRGFRIMHLRLFRACIVNEIPDIIVV